jgi:hypothetical protein
VAHLLKARYVEPEKQPLLGNAARNNRGMVTISDVTRTTVGIELSTHVSKETNSLKTRGSVFCVVRAKGP